SSSPWEGGREGGREAGCVIYACMRAHIGKYELLVPVTQRDSPYRSNSCTFPCLHWPPHCNMSTPASTERVPVPLRTINYRSEEGWNQQSIKASNQGIKSNHHVHQGRRRRRKSLARKEKLVLRGRSPPVGHPSNHSCSSMSSSSAAFSLDHLSPPPSEHLCYVHCNFCDTDLAVYPANSSLFIPSATTVTTAAAAVHSPVRGSASLLGLPSCSSYYLPALVLFSTSFPLTVISLLFPCSWQVSVPYTSLFKTVTVRCGHCTNLLSVNMRALLLPAANQLLHLSHPCFTPPHHNLLVYIYIYMYIYIAYFCVNCGLVFSSSVLPLLVPSVDFSLTLFCCVVAISVRMSYSAHLRAYC
ncbi:hypothetical protein BHE74_00036616, partial [Ensete ventricosum]